MENVPNPLELFRDIAVIQLAKDRKLQEYCLRKNIQFFKLGYVVHIVRACV